MSTILRKSGLLSDYESLSIAPELAVECFNKRENKEQDKISIDRIKNISKDIFYEIEINILAQERKLETVVHKNNSNQSFYNPVLASNPWEVDVVTETDYKNYTATYDINETNKNINCRSCNSQGKIICKKCNGQGLIICPKCKGLNSLIETSTAKKKGVLTRGVVGGVLAGPIGMVLGGATGKKQTTTSSKICSTCFW